jgi:hypothetical protein
MSANWKNSARNMDRRPTPAWGSSEYNDTEENDMCKAYLSAVVNGDGSLTIPAFAVRGMGYAPGDEVGLAIPTETCAAACGGSGLLIRRVCGSFQGGGNGYTTEGDEINLPEKLLTGCGVPLGSEISVLSADGMLIIAVTGDDERQCDLTDELGCFMEELGFDPELVQTVPALMPF